jgi:hypothetical protein
MVFQQDAGKQTTTPPERRRDNSSSAPSNEELSLSSLLQAVRPFLPVFHDGDQTGHVHFHGRQYQHQHQHQHQEEEVQRRTQSISETPSSRSSIICELIDSTLELLRDDTDLLFSSEDDAATAEEEEDLQQ